MLLNRWLKDLFHPRSRRPASHRRRQTSWPRTAHLVGQIETLEDRTLLSATVINVDTFDDVIDPLDGVTSLREAIIQANTTVGDFEIVLEVGTYTLTITGADEDAALTGDLDILNTGSVIITGAGAGMTTINASGLGDRVFDVHTGASLSLEGLTITGGVVVGDGGGVRNTGGTLVIDQSTLSGNSANAGGGIFNTDSSSVVTITDSTLSNNFASGFGGGLYTENSGSVEITSSLFSGNSAGSTGGGLYNQGSGSVEITSSTFSGNTTDAFGGGISNSDLGSVVSITDSLISGNSSGSFGGGVDNFAGGQIMLIHSTISDNTAFHVGGGIYNSDFDSTVTILGSTLSNNSASDGGGIYNDFSGSVEITNSTLSNNSATFGSGGGIYNSGFESTVTILGSTLSGNSANLDGGGIFNFSSGSVEITNSTLSGNLAGAFGGAILNLENIVTISNSTLTGNRADANGSGFGIGGGIWTENDDFTFTTLFNTIVAGNFVGTETTPDDLANKDMEAASSFNLIGDAGTSGGLLDGVDGNIVGNNGSGTLDIATVLDTELKDNGGPTLTHALVLGSLAIDAGDPNFDDSNLPFDQRGDGFPRIVVNAIDIGAFELRLQVQINAANPGDTLVFEIADSAALTALLNEVASVTPPTLGPGEDPITIQINLAADTIYTGQTINVPEGLVLVINGAAGNVQFTSGSPALTVQSGEVIVLNGMTFSVSTDDPTIVVESGGSLTLSDSTVHESDGFNQVAIFVHAGGVLDLSSGDNTINVRGAGQLIEWQDTGNLNIVGNTLQIDGMALDTGLLADNFTIEDAVTHALDNAAFGLVTWVNGQVFVTQDSGSIQRGVDAASAGDTVNVADGTYNEDVLIDKDDLHLRSANGAAVTVINGQSTGATAGAVRTASGVQNFTLGGVDIGFTINGAGQAGVYLGANNQGHIIQDNLINAADNRNALLTEGGQANHLIIGNTFGGNASQLVYINGTASVGVASTNVNFTDNIFSGSATGPLLGLESTDGTVTGNQFTGSTSYANLELWGGGNTVTGNTFNADGGGAYFLDPLNQYDIEDLIANNTFTGNIVTLERAGDPVDGVWGQIQDAIDAALSGDTVIVGAGTYEESVNVDKSVTLLGAQAGINPADRTAGDADESVLEATSGNGFSISASDVTIDGFSVTAGTGAVFGIGETAPVTGTTIVNNFIYELPALGVTLASSGFLIAENDIFANYAGVYLASGANSGTVTRNVIHDHTGASFTDDGSGVVLEGNNTNVSITENFITDNRIGVHVWDAFGTDFTGTTVFNNSITGNTTAVNNTNTATLDASGNWWGTTDEQAIDDLMTGPVDFTPFLASGVDQDLLTAGFQGDFSTLHVTTLGAQTQIGGRITEAVGLIADEGEILLEEGTFEETVTIDRSDLTSLTLRGLTSDSSLYVIDAGGDDAITITDPETVTIQDLRITNADAGIVATGLTTLNLANLLIDDSVSGGTLSDITNVNLSGTPENDTFNVDNTQFSVTGVQSISYTDVENLTLSGEDGEDTFNVEPITSTLLTIHGGDPTKLPGDTINYDGPGVVTFTDPGSGTITQDGFNTVTFTGIESVFTTDASPIIISITNVTQLEGDDGFTDFVFVVSLDRQVDAVVTVVVSTVGVAGPGGTTAGVDFVAKTETVTFDPGETSQEFVVQVIGNTIPEFDKIFLMTLEDPDAGGLDVEISETDGTGTGTILNDDVMVVVGAGPGAEPRVLVYDQLGNIRLNILAFNPNFEGGVHVATGDVNGDGTPDIIVGAGAGGGPHVRVFDGVSGDQIAGPLGSFFAYDPGFRGGVFVAAADLNNDLMADVITGAGEGGGPHVRAFSADDGAVLLNFMAYDAGLPGEPGVFTGGVRVAAGDVTGNGTPEVITGAGPGGGPHVRTFDGTTGSQIAGPLGSFFAYDPGFAGGVFVSAADLTGDLRTDIITGAGQGGGPHVRVFTAASGGDLLSFFAFDPQLTGGARVGVTDWNVDGQPDILVGAGTSNIPQALIIDGNSTGLTAVVLEEFSDFPPGFENGVFVAGSTLRPPSSSMLASGEDLDQIFADGELLDLL